MKPRILIISPVTPYPVHHGAGSAIYGYIRALREDFDIDFVGFCPERFQRQAQEGLNWLCRKAYLFSPPPARRLDAFSPTPFLFSNLQSDDMRRAVDHILRHEPPDLVQVEYFGMVSYAENARCSRILRAHVQEWWHYYLNWKRVRGWRAKLQNLFWSLDAIRQNKQMLESFHWVLVTSEEERMRARQLVPSVRAEALPFLLLDCDYFRPAPLPAPNQQMVFVGFLPHTPNEEALDYFIREILPLVRKQEPRASLLVAGEGASNAMLGLMHDNGVEYAGFVEDLRDIYHQSRVYVAPINSGGGIRTKIVEAMAAGIPVVASSFAPLGIGAIPDQHLIQQDRPQEYADSILHLLRDDAAWISLRDSARQFAEESYGLQKAGPRIRQRYLQFLEHAA